MIIMGQWTRVENNNEVFLRIFRVENNEVFNGLIIKIIIMLSN